MLFSTFNREAHLSHLIGEEDVTFRAFTISAAVRGFVMVHRLKMRRELLPAWGWNGKNERGSRGNYREQVQED